MNDQQLLRYSKHIMLPKIDYDGQMAICRSRVLIVGVGGLGVAALQYLAASGVGQLILCDHDRVELSNYQRQVIYTTADHDKLKVNAAAAWVTAHNPEVQVRVVPERISLQNAEELIGAVDLVIDACDNFQTRFMLHEIAYSAKCSIIMGAAIGFAGQILFTIPQNPKSACYHCLYEASLDECEQGCADQGVFAPLVGIIGAMQAAEALKYLVGFNKNPINQLQTYDALTSQWRTHQLVKDPACRVCGHHSEA